MVTLVMACAYVNDLHLVLPVYIIPRSLRMNKTYLRVKACPVAFLVFVSCLFALLIFYELAQLFILLAYILGDLI